MKDRLRGCVSSDGNLGDILGLVLFSAQHRFWLWKKKVPCPEGSQERIGSGWPGEGLRGAFRQFGA